VGKEFFPYQISKKFHRISFPPKFAENYLITASAAGCVSCACRQKSSSVEKGFVSLSHALQMLVALRAFFKKVGKTVWPQGKHLGRTIGIYFNAPRLCRGCGSKVQRLPFEKIPLYDCRPPPHTCSQARSPRELAVFSVKKKSAAQNWEENVGFL
jgi:hypothetical protein